METGWLKGAIYAKICYTPVLQSPGLTVQAVTVARRPKAMVEKSLICMVKWLMFDREDELKKRELSTVFYTLTIAHYDQHP